MHDICCTTDNSFFPLSLVTCGSNKTDIKSGTVIKDAINILQPLYISPVFYNYTFQISDALDILHSKQEKKSAKRMSWTVDPNIKVILINK